MICKGEIVWIVCYDQNNIICDKDQIWIRLRLDMDVIKYEKDQM